MGNTFSWRLIGCLLPFVKGHPVWTAIFICTRPFASFNWHAYLGSLTRALVQTELLYGALEQLEQGEGGGRKIMA